MDSSSFIQRHLTASAELKLEIGKRYATEIGRLGTAIASCLLRGNKLLTCGNGGSAADSEHITAEFVGRFRRERRSLPSIALTCPSALITAIGNDYGYDQIFSRQVEGQGRRGDVLLCLSTSGNSLSVVNGAVTAKGMGIQTIGFTGESGGLLAQEVDTAILVPSKTTALIQEAHITIAHILCELADEIIEHGTQTPRLNEKILKLEELAAMRQIWRRHNRTVVWTNGCFDLLHNGHVRNLFEAKAEGDILIVGINSDRSVQAIKGPSRPIQDEQSRAEMLAALACVDYVTIFDDLTPESTLEVIQPDVHCKGADYANNQKAIPERETVEKYGGRIHFLEILPGYSTTSLIERIRSQKNSI